MSPARDSGNTRAPSAITLRSLCSRDSRGVSVSTIAAHRTPATLLAASHANAAPADQDAAIELPARDPRGDGMREIRIVDRLL